MNALDRIVGWTEKAVTAVSVLALMVITLVMAAQVIWRYVLADPLLWSEFVAVYALVWVVFLGAGMLGRRDDHISIRSFVDLLPPGAQAVFAALSRLAVLIFAGMVVVLATNWLLFGRHPISPSLGFSTIWVKLALPVGMVVLMLFAGRDFLKDILQMLRGSAPDTDTDTGSQ